MKMAPANIDDSTNPRIFFLQSLDNAYSLMESCGQVLLTIKVFNIRPLKKTPIVH